MAKSDGRAFVIKEDKVEKFMSQKDKTKFDTALKRAEEHKKNKKEQKDIRTKSDFLLEFPQ